MCTRGSTSHLVTAGHRGVKCFCPSWMMEKSKPQASLLLLDQIQGSFMPRGGLALAGEGTSVALSSCVPTEVRRLAVVLALVGQDIHELLTGMI